MGFRFWRRIKLAPGVSLNLSKSGPSISVGPRGAKFTVGPKGTRTTVGIPGTGLFYTQTQGTGSTSRNVSSPTQPVSAPPSSLGPGFFQRLVTTPEEQAFVDGCREMVSGNKDTALAHLRKAGHLSDGAFVAGILATDKDLLQEAEQYFVFAVQNSKELGTLFAKYGITATMYLGITDEFTAVVTPSERSALLALVEVYHREKRYDEAAKTLQRLFDLDPSDPVVRLAITEIYMETRPKDDIACHKVIQLASDMENDSPIHAVLLLYKAKALRGLNMPTAAAEVLSKIIRKTRDRSDELLRAIRYERALAYQDSGENSRYRADLEKLYAEYPDYEDVAKRLGV